MTLSTPLNTLDTFIAWITQPEQAEKRYEFIQAEMVEKRGSNQVPSRIGARINLYLGMYLLQQPLGRLTGADGMYRVGDDVYIPDVGYISSTRQPTPNMDTVNPLAPDLAVEVISPTDRPKFVLLKTLNYLAAGVTVWQVWPDEQEVTVHQQGQPTQTLTLDDTLTGGDLLPGFALPLKTLFADA